jgi:transcriptional regulator with XRE-family HTH domain
LQAEREHAKLSQAELAEGAGLAPNHVARLERGEKAFPRFDTVAKLARELGVSLDWIAAECGIGPEVRREQGPTLRRVLSAVTAAAARSDEAQSELRDAAAQLQAALSLSRRRK